MKHLTNFKTFEGSAYKATKKPHETKEWDIDKKDSFRKKIKDHIISLGCKTKQVGNDLEIHCKGNHIGQVMFRDDYVGVKDNNNKFPTEFKYTELGNIKSEVSNIIKKCK